MDFKLIRLVNGKTINTLKVTVLGFVFFSAILSCSDRFEDNPKYQRPEWLVGKVYSQIAANDSMTLFAQMISDVGYDSVLDKSGTYAAFVPMNDAVQEYLVKKGYSSVEDIPYNDKLRLVKYHVVQMPWSSLQLQGLSGRGWISADNISNYRPYSFKRQTLLRNSNKTYPILYQAETGYTLETIVPVEESNQERTVYANSRKYVPLFFDGFMEAAKLTGDDYAYYFDREYETGNIFYAGAKVLGDEIFSDNGFIYLIDKVVEPLDNAEEIMENGVDNYSYSVFKNLIHEGSEFDFNEDATYAQAGASEGFEVEDLYDLTYPNLEFDIHQELTATTEKYTMEDHLGIIVPTDDAMQNFAEEILSQNGEKDFEDIPSRLKEIIINTHMSEEPIYAADIEEGFHNAENDLVKIDPNTIVHKQYGSNATFIGVNEVIVPKALSSVSSPLYLEPKYITYLMALDYSNLLDALKSEDYEFSLFAIPESVTNFDESLILEWDSPREEEYSLQTNDLGAEKWITLRTAQVSEMLFNNIGVEPLMGLAKKEFIETLNQKHIVIDNQNSTITGGSPSVFGYMGDSTVINNFHSVDGDFYNGKVYEMGAWLNFPTQTLLTKLLGSQFFELMKKAGLATDYSLVFADETERYTVFFPSDDALATVHADTLTGENLKELLLSHILKDELIFTDGRKSSGAYNTLYKANNTDDHKKLNVTPAIDEITILDDDMDVITTIPEDESKANIITIKTLNDRNVTSAVIHKIDTVLCTNF